MAKYTQDSRFMAVTTPLGKDVLLLENFSGSEGISQLFQFKLGMFADAQSKITFDQILGQKVTVQLGVTGGGPPRYFSGIISRFSQGHRQQGLDQKATLIYYEAELVPKFWLLTRNVQSRIFQHLSVPEILQKVLTGLEVSYEIQGTFSPRDYCVQYRESDFAFASRLMEEEGIYYFFKHTANGHQMVVANTPQSHPEVPGASSVEYDEIRGGVRQQERITSWFKSQEIRSGKETLWDHCFEMPDNNLQASQTILESVSAGTISHKLKTGGNDKLEVYDYPGRYAQRFDGINSGGGEQPSDLQKIFTDNKRTAGIRMQEEAAAGLVIEGESDCRPLVSGHKFTLTKHYNADGQYVLTELHHQASVEGAYTSGPRKGMVYRNTFKCIPFALPFRPAQVTPKARVEGTQTAVVVGPAGEEIFTDKYSRVKVQFFWDRQGQKNADSSCWVRVGTLWAGKQWGVIHIPRIGQEVIVAFEEGDPDQPIIVGSVYNADQMPPYTLPANKTQSGIKSRSSLKGTAEDFNELRFEDKKDNEDIYFHAQKDFHRLVEHDDDCQVGHDQTLTVKHDQTETVKHDRTRTVEHDETRTINHDQTLTVKNNRTLTITQDQKLTIQQGNRSAEIQMGDDTTKISMGNRSTTLDMGNDTTKLNLGASSTEAMQQIVLKVGGNSITIDQTGVTIKGIMVTIEGEAMLSVKSPMSQVQGEGMLMLKGGITMIN
jgi:type VI secretion system secreted protein VgrG